MYKSLNCHLTKGENDFILFVSHDGYTHFGELRAGAGYARRFGHKLSISLQGIYLAQHAEHYRSQHSLTVDMSGVYEITSHWGLAIRLFNPIQMRYGITGTEVIPMEFSLQVHHRWDEKLLAYLLLQKRVPGDFDVDLGLYYKPSKYLLLSGNCSLRHLGIGVCIPWRHLIISIQSAWHFRISFSNAASAYYLFNI